MFNEAANKAYIQTQFEIEAEIEKLKDALATHNEVVNIHWGHVGDMKCILNKFKKINGYATKATNRQ